MNPTLIEKLKEVVTVLSALPGCSPVSVGGSVRDAVILGGTKNIESSLEFASKDFDLEVFGATSASVYAALKGADIDVELVGRNFPVYKVHGWEIDISFPRLETKTGDGHTDFSIVVDSGMTFKAGAERRDFSVNAIGYDWKTKTLLDPYNGIKDIEAKILNPVSEKFKEDALRVMRCFKFIARLGFTPSDQTLDYCYELAPALRGYARERLYPEWNDFLLHSKPEYIGMAMVFLINSGAIDLYPTLKALIVTPQHPEHHPEGNAFLHTIHCLEHYAKQVRDTLKEEDKLIVGYAVLTHDLGKASTTKMVDGGLVAYGHEDTEDCRIFMSSLFDPADNIVSRVEKLVKAHMRPMMLYKVKSGASGLRRLNLAVEGRIDLLMKVVECDQGGRPPKPIDRQGIYWILDNSIQLFGMDTTVIKPIILGRHLITHLNLKPGPDFKPILTKMFEAQLDGEFVDELSGIEYLKTHFSS